MSATRGQSERREAGRGKSFSHGLGDSVPPAAHSPPRPARLGSHDIPDVATWSGSGADVPLDRAGIATVNRRCLRPLGSGTGSRVVLMPDNAKRRRGSRTKRGEAPAHKPGRQPGKGSFLQRQLAKRPRKTRTLSFHHVQLVGGGRWAMPVTDRNRPARAVAAD
jgi:hypothetical protein